MNRPALAAIINLTPDSFSGDGVMGDAAMVAAIEAVAAGAGLLDIGAESTRPGATPVTPEEEWTRLEPFLTAFGQTSWLKKPLLGIDTRHASTAAKALALGADIINDEGGLQDPAMCRALAKSSCDIVVMHALSIPADKAKVWDASVDPVTEILGWKARLTEHVLACGVAPQRLIFDPGIGFGKTPAQSLALVMQAKTLVESGGRWFYGHSRKSFLTLFTDAAPAERDALTLAFSAVLAQAGVHYLRVHALAAHHALLDEICT